jgi:hypothetical protein
MGGEGGQKSAFLRLYFRTFQKLRQAGGVHPYGDNFLDLEPLAVTHMRRTTLGQLKMELGTLLALCDDKTRAALKGIARALAGRVAGRYRCVVTMDVQSTCASRIWVSRD